MHFLSLISIGLITCKAHLHEIIFLVDNSYPILNEQECADRQLGISNYFKAFHDLNVGNVLSYVSFDHQSSTKIIDFEDNDTMDFRGIAHKIKNLPCNSYNDNKNNDYDLLDALKYSISLFSDKNILTPRILLFNNFKNTNNEDKICNYFQNYDRMFNNKGDIISISEVNILGYGLKPNYLKCLTQVWNETKSWDNTARFFEFNNISPAEFSLYQSQVIESVSSSLPNGHRHLQEDGTTTTTSTSTTSTPFGDGTTSSTSTSTSTTSGTSSTTTTSSTTSTTGSTTSTTSSTEGGDDDSSDSDSYDDALFVPNNMDQNMLNMKNEDDSLTLWSLLQISFSSITVWNVIVIFAFCMAANGCFLCAWAITKKQTITRK